MADDTKIRDEKGRILPGHSLNPRGKTPGTKAIKSKVVSKLSQFWMNNVLAPDEWFTGGLDFLKKDGLNPKIYISEVIAARRLYCLATNTKYQNPALLKDFIEQMEGRLPYRHITKEEEDDSDEMTPEQEEEYVKNFEARILAAAEEKRKRLEEPEAQEEADAPEESNTSTIE